MQRDELDEFFSGLGFELWRYASESLVTATDEALDDNPTYRIRVIEGMMRAADYKGGAMPDLASVESFLVRRMV